MVAILAVLLLAGLAVRLDDMQSWSENPDLFLYGDEPLLVTFDGYYYLTLAQDLIDGTYASVDEKRAVPDHPARPMPPPLLSLVTAGIAKLSPFSLNQVAVFLPALLGLTIALPLFAFGARWGGMPAALTAVGLGLLSRYYVYRTSIAVYDTDCMIVTFTLGIAYCFLRFGRGAGRERNIYLATGAVLYVLFLVWWDSTPAVVTILTLTSLGLAVGLYYRPTRAEGRKVAIIAAVGFVLLLLALGWDRVIGLSESVLRTMRYVVKTRTTDFPPMGLTVNEQAAFSLGEVIKQSTAGVIGFAVSLVGLALLGIRHRTEALFLIMPLALGCSSVVLGQRFAIFLAPILALGAAYAVAFAWERFGSQRWIAAPILAFLAYAVWAQFDLSTRTAASYPAKAVEGFISIRDRTPEDAVIWSWWDEGYPLVYWARRATVNDGQVHSGERTTYTAIPLAATDPRLAANFMQFYVARGVNGIHSFYEAAGGDRAAGLATIKEVLAAGPDQARSILQFANLKPAGDRSSIEDWIEFFYPLESRPIYLHIGQRHPGRTPWIVWMGTWSLDRRDGEHPLPTYPVQGVTLDGNSIRHPNLNVDLSTGTSVQGGNTIMLGSVAVTGTGATHEYTYEDSPGQRRTDLHGGNFPEPFGTSGTYHVEVHLPSRQAIFQDQRIGNAMINRMYWRKPTGADSYFRAVLDNHPHYVLWEVRGDRR